MSKKANSKSPAKTKRSKPKRRTTKEDIDQSSLHSLLKGKDPNQFTAYQLSHRARLHESRSEQAEAALLYRAAADRARQEFEDGISSRNYRMVYLASAGINLSRSGNKEAAEQVLHEVTTYDWVGNRLRCEEWAFLRACAELMTIAHGRGKDAFEHMFEQAVERCRPLGRNFARSTSGEVLDMAHDLGCTSIVRELIPHLKKRRPLPRALRARIKEIEADLAGQDQDEGPKARKSAAKKTKKTAKSKRPSARKTKLATEASAAKEAPPGLDGRTAMEERRFTFADGKSDKFWHITLDGDSHTVHFGRAGTKGQTRSKEFPTEEKARASLDKLIAQKLKKGYVEVVDHGSGAATECQQSGGELTGGGSTPIITDPVRDLLARNDIPYAIFVRVSDGATEEYGRRDALPYGGRLLDGYFRNTEAKRTLYEGLGTVIRPQQVGQGTLHGLLDRTRDGILFGICTIDEEAQLSGEARIEQLKARQAWIKGFLAEVKSCLDQAEAGTPATGSPRSTRDDMPRVSIADATLRSLMNGEDPSDLQALQLESRAYARREEGHHSEAAILYQLAADRAQQEFEDGFTRVNQFIIEYTRAAINLNLSGDHENAEPAMLAAATADDWADRGHCWHRHLVEQAFVELLKNARRRGRDAFEHAFAQAVERCRELDWEFPASYAKQEEVLDLAFEIGSNSTAQNLASRMRERPLLSREADARIEKIELELSPGGRDGPPKAQEVSGKREAKRTTATSVTERRREELPVSKYHPDPVSSGVFVKTGKACPVCSRRRGYGYVGNIYSIEEPEDICPWCIADGSAAEKYDASFVEDYGQEPVSDPGKQEELIRRTPATFDAAKGRWPTHCDDFCAFLGRASWENVGPLMPDPEPELQRISTELQITLAELVEELKREPESPLLVQLFRCLHCGRHRLCADYE